MYPSTVERFLMGFHFDAPGILILQARVYYGSVSTGWYYMKLILLYTHYVYGPAWINQIALVRPFPESKRGFVHRGRCQITMDPCYSTPPPPPKKQNKQKKTKKNEYTQMKLSQLTECFL